MTTHTTPLEAGEGTAPRAGWGERLALAAVAVALLGVTGLLAYRATRGGPPPRVELPVLGTLPDYTLTAQTGAPFSGRSLGGSVYVADFIFTSCRMQCARMSARMQTLQKELPARGDLRFVSFSVDPETDTPARLTEYARSYAASPDRWTFLTGPKREILDLCVRGFKLARPDDATDDAIIHSPHFVLVDREGRIRGYYDHTDEPAMARLKRDVGILLR